MSKKIIFLFILITSYSFSQSINDYEYVIVPIKFDFFKENDRYRLNTNTKLLLQKYGFKAFINNEDLPQAITDKRCSILYASLVQDNSFFMTKIKLILKDCKDVVVYETEFGVSRSKEYAIAYNEALRMAAKSFDKLNYKYNPAQPTDKSLGMIGEPATSNSIVAKTEATKTQISGQLFAQPITNGFQLINTEPKVIYKIYYTTKKDYFIATKADQQGIFFAKDNNWFFEYYQNEKLFSEKVEVKF